MYLVVALSAGGTGAGQNKYTFAFFLPLDLMSPFATEVLFGNYRKYFSICVEFHCLEAKLKIIGYIFIYFQVHCYWQQVPFIALRIPAWSHNHSQDCTGHMRSSMGMSTKCVYATEKREGLATYNRRIL